MTAPIIAALLKLDATSLRVYVVLASAQRGRDNVRMTRETLAAILGRSLRTVTRSLTSLRRAKLLYSTGKRSAYAVITRPN